MALSLNLTKAENSLKLCLQKSGLLEAPQVDLAFVLDVSGSFDDEHRAGVTDALLIRLVPWGMTFDPDRQLDVFTFSSGKSSAHHVGAVTPDNCEGYVQREIINKVPGYGSGTDYSPVLERVLQAFGWSPEKQGFLSRLLGASSSPSPVRRPSLIIFVTDGDNSDKTETLQTLAQSEQRGDEVYFMFVGISNQGGKFPFLNQIATRFGNTGLSVIQNLRSFTAQTDDQLNACLLQPELLTWLKQGSTTARD